MILNKFRTGWQEAFGPKLEYLFKLFPDLETISVERVHGFLRIKLKSPLDNLHQYIVDCVTYKIERESARTCEVCGRYGRCRESHLPEKMTLCWKCYALEIDSLLQNNTSSII